jgi:hypothetical protein
VRLGEKLFIAGVAIALSIVLLLRTDRSKETSSGQGDENEVNSRTKQHGQIDQRQHNRDWWMLQNIGEVSNSVASRKVPAASMTKWLARAKQSFIPT